MNRMPNAVCLTVCAWALVGGASARAADPTTADCLGATEASLTLRNQHKLRDARAQLLICSAASCPGDIRGECTRRVAEVNAAMPTIVFETKDGAGNDISAVRVLMDGGMLAERLEGTAISIDPGEHSFVFQRGDEPPVQKVFVIREGEKERRERVVFGGPTPPALATNAMPAAPAGASTAVTVPAAGPGTSYWTGQRIAAIAAGGVGVAGLAVGTAFGLIAMSRHDDATKVCPATCADQHGVDLWDSARSAGTISNVGFIVGAVGVASGAVLWLTASQPGGVATGVAVGPGALRLTGVW